MTKANLVIVLSGLLIIACTLIAILIARGYLPDLNTRSIQATGILVATSDPDGALVFVNNKLTTATNNTINLPPGSYDVRIDKDGFSSWSKKIEIKKEEVIKTNVFLFPKVPDLRPLTLTGALNPQVSVDERKIAYGIASASAEKNGVWVLDMDGGRPIIGGFGSRKIYQDSPELSLSDASFLWGPDNLQVLAYYKSGSAPLASASGNLYHSLGNEKLRGYLLQTNQLNSLPMSMSQEQLTSILEGWADLWDEKDSLLLAKLDPRLALFLKNNAKNFSIPLDESKVLYTATNSATIPTLINYYLPGTNPTPSVRTIQPDNIYVYDIKEDRNYLIETCKLKTRLPDGQVESCTWFPSSKHLLIHNDREISVAEFDGANKSVLYTGPFSKDLIVAWPNWSKIVILTSLNSLVGGENLYTLNLR